MEAEHEFASVAFDILDKNALFQILAKLNPVSVLSLCQSNINFRRLCREKSTFISLMKLHYPSFRVDYVNPKEQYMKITAKEGVVYSIDIIDNKYTKIDTLGNRVWIGYKFDDKAYVNTDYTMGESEAKERFKRENNVPYFERTSISFLILGTRIRKGEELYGVVFEFGETNEYRIKVFSSHEEASDYIPIDLYYDLLNRLRRTYSLLINNDDKDEDDLRSFILSINYDDPDFVRFLQGRGWPTPFTRSNYEKYISDNNFWSYDDLLDLNSDRAEERHVEQIIKFTIQ